MQIPIEQLLNIPEIQVLNVEISGADFSLNPRLRLFEKSNR